MDAKHHVKDDFKDHYATLGIEPGAKPAAVKRAYRKLARQYHPDVSAHPDAEARFKAVAEAHAVLINADQRAAYDAAVKRRAQGPMFDEPPAANPHRAGPRFDGDAAGLDDFLESLFAQNGARSGSSARRGHRARAPQPGHDQHAALTVTLHDAYHGARRTLSLPPAPSAPYQPLRQLEVTIPRGVRPGQQLRLAGQGDAGEAGAPAGDLYLQMQFEPHPTFRLDGRDVFFDLPVAPWEAALGASVTAPTPDAGQVELGVPAGSQPGRRLRLRGKGLPGQPAGDLYAVLTIALPGAGSEPERQAWQALAAAYPGYDPRAGVAA